MGTMGCLHISSENIHLTDIQGALRTLVKTPSILSISDSQGNADASSFDEGVDNIDNISCAAGRCDARDTIYVCLTCGNLGCGRDLNQHALQHYIKSKHPLAVTARSHVPYCYVCDDYISASTEQTKEILEGARNLIRTTLQQYDSSTESSVNSPKEVDGEQAVEGLKGIGTEGNVKETREAEVQTNISQQVSKPSRKRKVDHIANTRKIKGVTGLKNLGNSCFMNTIIQSLSGATPLRDYFLKNFSPNIPQGASPVNTSPRTRRATSLGEISLCTEFCHLFREIWSGEHQYITPDSFFATVCKAVPIYRTYQQQDAQEFLRYLLDRLHTEFSAGCAPGTHTIIEKLFDGMLWNKVTCLECEHVSEKDDPYMDLSLDIPEEFVKRKNKVEQRVYPCTIYDCLRSYTETERLALTELYSCPNCRKPQPCTKKFTIKKLPDILCLHLKRFRWSRASRSKIDTYVSFPIEGLDMTPFTTHPEKTHAYLYDLFAVVVHHGSGPSSGHYVSYTWNAAADRWFYMNDAKVSESRAEALIEENVYMLFYKRRRTKNQRIVNVGTLIPGTSAATPLMLSTPTSSPEGSVLQSPVSETGSIFSMSGLTTPVSQRTEIAEGASQSSMSEEDVEAEEERKRRKVDKHKLASSVENAVIVRTDVKEEDSTGHERNGDSQNVKGKGRGNGHGRGKPKG